MLRSVDFEALFAASPNPYVLIDSELRLVAMNEAYLRVTGSAREALVGRHMFDAFPSDPASDSHRMLRGSLERVVETGEPDHLPLIRYDIPVANGVGSEERYWSATHMPVPDRDGGTAYILQHTVDVTELQRLRSLARDTSAAGASARVESDVFRRAEAVQANNLALDQERRHLRGLFAQAPGFMAVLSGPDHIFTMTNAAYHQIVGRDDLDGLPVRVALPEMVDQGFIELLDQVYQTGTPFVGRGVQILIGGGERFVDFVYQPIFGPDETVTGIFVQGHDVTEQQQAGAALKRLNETLEARVLAEIGERRQAEVALQQAQKMDAIGKLTGGVAHDFNNLLQVVSGNLQLLASDLGGDARAARRVANALAAVDRGAKLASQLLAFGRRQPLDPKVVDVGKLIAGMDDMLRRAIGDGIHIDVVVDETLWNTFVDPGQVENALLNLAINARDAMDGGGRLHIEAANARLDEAYARRNADVVAGDYVMLAVSDIGCGMPPEVLEQVFEPFFSTKPEGKGTGLGLSMVYGFVKQSGGHVNIASQVGYGTTVRLYLPRALAAEEVSVAPVVADVVGGDETVLVVEDDEAVRATAVELLGELGYRVLEARDAASALALIEQGTAIDLLFTDVVMPGPLRSPELARRAQALLPNLAVLYTSGYAESAIVHGGRLDEGVELLSKPYSRETLARKVRATLARRAA